MGFYTITPKEIEQNFNVKHEEITEYFKCLAQESYCKDINLYPSIFNQLLTAYKNGKECFTEKLKEIHENKIEVLKEIVGDKFSKISDNDVIKEMLDENNCKDLTIQAYAAIKSLERVYSDLMKYVNEELYYTSFFEGKLHLYGNILIDSEGLHHSCEMYGVICNILTKIQKGRDEYKDFFERITNVLENRKEFCSNCVAYDKLKLLVYGIDPKTSNEKSFTEYYKILMNEMVEEICIKYISLRRTQKIANMEIFQLSKKMIEFNFVYQYPMIESSIFLLRQSIEVQVKNSLNIGELRNINKNGKMTSEVGISKILDFIDEKIKDKKLVIAVDITTLKKINSWLNKYIHTGKMSYGMWYIEWIHYYLLDFFHLSDLYRKHMKYSNLEASIIIEENLYKNLDKEIENFFKNKVKLVHQRNNIAYVVDQKTIDSILVDKNKSK